MPVCGGIAPRSLSSGQRQLREGSRTIQMSVKVDLNGARVLVTRPAQQGAALCCRIRDHGGQPILAPVIEIVPNNDAAVEAVMRRHREFHMAVFVSTNAVYFAQPWLDRYPLAPGTDIAAIGRGTARALARIGLRANIVPSRGHDSEALLAADEMHAVTRRNIVIFRGEGGREHLARTLRERGGEVVYAEVYRRLLPATSLDAMIAPNAIEDLDIIVTTSNEGLANLVSLTPDAARPTLFARPLIVFSQRAGTLAAKLGFEGEVIVAEPGDDGVLAALARWRHH